MSEIEREKSTYHNYKIDNQRLVMTYHDGDLVDAMLYVDSDTHVMIDSVDGSVRETLENLKELINCALEDIA